MSLRILALYTVVAGLSIYAWKDWFKSLCGLILLMAVMEHGDMPKAMFGIQGLNPWNILFLVVFLAWLVNRRREGLTWDMPRHVSLLLLICLGVIVIGFLRAVFDRSYLEAYPLKNLISEELINTIKWVLPGLLLFDGCRTRKRVVMALTCLLVMYFLIAVQVIRNMPSEAALADGGRIMNYTRLKLSKKVGYAATDLSVMLGGACWGTLAVLSLVHAKKYKAMILAAAGVVAFGQALTGGRAGYMAWAVTGLVLCLIKWRKYLILTPVVVVLVSLLFPGAVTRMMTGFGQTDVTGQATVDPLAVTSGRNRIWPAVIDGINDSPWIGYGRRAMQRTGTQERLLNEYGDGEAVAHPHNMYLEVLLDNGVLGSIPFFILWALVVVHSAGLFRDGNRLYSAVGGLALALMLTGLIGGLSGQHYFPQEHTLGVWAAIFLCLRVSLEERQAQVAAGTCTDLLEPSPESGQWAATVRRPT